MPPNLWGNQGAKHRHTVQQVYRDHGKGDKQWIQQKRQKRRNFVLSMHSHKVNKRTKLVYVHLCIVQVKNEFVPVYLLLQIFWEGVGGVAWVGGGGVKLRAPLKNRKQKHQNVFIENLWKDETAPQSTHRAAMATFWRTFHHYGKTSPAWWWVGVHALPLSLYLPSRAKLWCTLYSWEGRYPPPISPLPPICTLWTTPGLHGNPSLLRTIYSFMLHLVSWGVLNSWTRDFILTLRKLYFVSLFKFYPLREFGLCDVLFFISYVL